ncbi:RAD51-associated protein 1 isoform X5 [Micropterus dolomieu]|uniref:RAD51-associated protein 1 isoform X5 n=1 Tax=Micropterus dolomieu TaxID=147949 RepID=UPI001E8D657F|nr:RAD51-associated protein 1 isoform X5 [Micropterus dolomieu]
MDRPSRKTKTVNYCEAKDFDDADDDFACAMAPPSKKAREDVKQEHKRSSSQSFGQESNSQSTVIQKSRRPLDEKLHERDLEAAITLSLLNNADGIKDQSSTSKGLDEITLEKESLALSRQRKESVTKATEEHKKKPMDEDEDYEPKLMPDSESDEDFSEPAESEDEEFTVKKVSKTKKEKATKNVKTKPQPSASKKEKRTSKPSKSKSQAAGCLTAASTPVRSPPTAKLAPKRPASSSTASTSKPAFSLNPAGGRIPKWTPPGQIGRSPNSSQSPAVKSPGQGLRLGLSRVVRVKPLHPSVASH